MRLALRWCVRTGRGGDVLHRLALACAPIAWACLVSTPCHAGAWNQEAGHGLVIFDYTFSGGSKYFNGSGKLSPAAAYSKQEAIGYLEYGVTDMVTVILKPSLTAISAASSPQPGSTTAHYAGLGTSEAGAQLHVATIGTVVFAVQGTVRLPASTSQDNPARIGNTSRDVDLRGLAGSTFRLGAWDAFVDAEAGYRFRSGGAPGEWHADLTAGARVAPRWIALVQSFNVLAVGSGTAWFPPASYSKLGVGGIYELSPRWSVELEGFQTLWGKGALRERALEAALWYRF